MKILSVDPGFERVGIAIIERVNNKDSVIYSECFKTSKNDLFPKRLLDIGEKTKKILEEYNPSALAIEVLFFGKNQKTALLVSEARGVIVYEASSFGIPVFEYTPLQIKIALTGYGKATKEQIIAMVPRLTHFKNGKHAEKKIKSSDDEFDAIAIGLTHLASVR